MLPKPPFLNQSDIQSYLSKAGPIQLVHYKLWQKTLIQTLSLGETLPCPFLVRAILDDVHAKPIGTNELSGDDYQEAAKRSVQERRFTDPFFDKALHLIANLPSGSIPENLAYLLHRSGENLLLPQLEISSAEVRQAKHSQKNLENGELSSGEAGEIPWPNWGTSTIQAMLAPRFALDHCDLALLESGGATWSASERKWFAEVLAAKQWFQKWRRSTPLPRLMGDSLVWESRQNLENQQEGGLETLVPKGTLENLLPSELIWIGESTNLFSWKWSQGELLYFGREHSTALRPSLRWNLVWDPRTLDWQFWPKGCPGRMGAMALGWILSVLEAIYNDRGPWDFSTQWILLEKPGTNWEDSIKPLRHIVKSLWPYPAEWGKTIATDASPGNSQKQTHQCSIHFGCSKSSPNTIHLHPQTEVVEENPTNFPLVGTPQSPEDWLEWDERVMSELGIFWIATGE